MATTTEGLTTGKTWLKTRLFSLATLAGVVCGLGYVAHTVYGVATDAFVAPVILSPESDMVIQSKLSMSQLLAEKMRISAQKEQIDAELQATAQAIEKLEGLYAATSKALDWTSSITSKQAAVGKKDLAAIAKQRSVLTTMIGQQEKFVAQLKTDLEVGLVAKADYAREEVALNEMRVAAIDNDRARFVTEMQMNQVTMTQRSMQTIGTPGHVATPEMVMQQDQLVRVQCDLLKLEAERRVKLSERRRIEEELAKLDSLVGELKSRPIFRATEANTNVAFVPYTQIDGVREGARIYDCVWGLIACKSVGRVVEVLPGEVVVPDPWGTPARGQYAILDLDESRAAESRTLRVRPGTAPAIARRPTLPENRFAKR